VKTKNTTPERILCSELFKLGLRYRKHVQNLPGRPDIVFSKVRLAIFIDGDFWHGYQFHHLKKKLKPFWLDKIGRNRKRDCKNIIELRRMGWKVVRIWEHQVEKNLPATIERILRILRRLAFQRGL
jgi:DNA mismatch endonuclease (patch repair protein)